MDQLFRVRDTGFRFSRYDHQRSAQNIDEFVAFPQGQAPEDLSYVGLGENMHFGGGTVTVGCSW